MSVYHYAHNSLAKIFTRSRLSLMSAHVSERGFPVPLWAFGAAVLALMAVGTIRVLSENALESVSSTLPRSEALFENGDQWDEEHCIGGARHDMYTNGYETQKGHLRLRWDCQNCPYWYLT